MDAEKAFEKKKNPTPFIIKTQYTRNRKISLNLIKGGKPTGNVIMNVSVNFISI